MATHTTRLLHQFLLILTLGTVSLIFEIYWTTHAIIEGNASTPEKNLWKYFSSFVSTRNAQIYISSIGFDSFAGRFTSPKPWNHSQFFPGRRKIDARDSAIYSFANISSASAAIPLVLTVSSENASSITTTKANTSGRKEHPDNTFSACILVMDDNHRLVEWIAYHYYALNLRHLVVTVDPHSRTRPTAVLDRWRDRMYIEEWNDRSFLPSNIGRSANDTVEQRHLKHRFRQAQFYKGCIRRLREFNRSWTTFIDSDEYLTINSRMVDNTALRMQQPGHVADYFHELTWQAHSGPNYTFAVNFGQSCVLLSRAMYGSVESTDEEIRRDVPDFLDPARFDTLRWRHRSTEDDHVLAKSLIDVSQVKQHHLDGKANAHKALVEMCKSNSWIAYTLPIGIHHYLGSWEQYSYRDDARDGGDAHSYETWQRKGSALVSTDDEIRPWIRGFVKMVGNGTALSLLEGAGLPTNRTA
ncbi:predicted protein [Phaeodactylum tricornutum CCAP 1055/1]|uniref:Glycosyltransferase family 92 protein n=1 Tax=Phaeodactylum tricornutum (strain CCAP 1055/1) TaxID=556484 RepID=B7G1W3_PHATC|nr:predicted protein [Phaeodactylum tricornutum CCAP 1055/1]EEC47576.1 predicted protein [Phaeodactylum tricornutum CCAP 1055/1]|eukprot:XP_002180924.1 predicted protein [Phaeodactylum tricornutum CCAP 1055/1]